MNIAPEIECSLPLHDLISYTSGQINSSFPDKNVIEMQDLEGAAVAALDRLSFCFSHVENRYFSVGSCSKFNHLHGDQYAMWLYFLSNELFRQNGDQNICSKLFLLNKMLHGCDIFYEVELPRIFLLVHPLGTVLGRGEYQDFFVAYQRCGIGSNHDVYPKLGKHLTLRPGASILGSCVIGDNCQIAAESLLLDAQINNNSTVMGQPGQLRKKENTQPYPLWRTNV